MTLAVIAFCFVLIANILITRFLHRSCNGFILQYYVLWAEKKLSFLFIFPFLMFYRKGGRTFSKFFFKSICEVRCATDADLLHHL